MDSADRSRFQALPYVGVMSALAWWSGGPRVGMRGSLFRMEQPEATLRIGDASGPSAPVLVFREAARQFFLVN